MSRASLGAIGRTPRGPCTLRLKLVSTEYVLCLHGTRRFLSRNIFRDRSFIPPALSK